MCFVYKVNLACQLKVHVHVHVQYTVGQIFIASTVYLHV